MNLAKYGWNSFHAENFKNYARQDLTIGRVALEHKGLYRLYTEHGELWAEITGKMRYQTVDRGGLPAVGDWVVIRILEGENRAMIHEVLPRKSKFSRKVAGAKTEEQIIASNIDTVFLIAGLDGDFNPRRVERYLIMTWESGANPVIVLNKADLCEDLEQKVREMESVAPGVPILVISATTGESMENLLPFLGEGQTVSLLGSSGVGKSTIINHLMGQEIQRVQEVRLGDDRGKHTTTSRQLILLPCGALIMDTPGMRELQLWVGEDSLQGAFEEIESLARQCYFRNCRHQDEPDCAVRQALMDGELDLQRFENYQKIQRELKYLALKQDHKASLIEKQRWKRIHRMMKKNKDRW